MKIAPIVIALFVFMATSAQAQFGFITKPVGKLVKVIDDHVDVGNGDAASNDDQSGVNGVLDRLSSGDSATKTKAAVGQKKLEDGVAAIVRTSMRRDIATSKVKEYLSRKNIDFQVNPDTGRIRSDWYDHRRCGPGFQWCENKASILVTTQDGQTAVQIQVTERKREGGVSEKPWNENSESKGKQTAQLAAELEALLDAVPSVASN